MRSVFKGLLFIFLLLSGIAAIGIYVTFYKPLPDYSATLHVSGLQETVDVHWDPYGTPYIYAANENDLYFAIGYLHAQERLWQLTLTQLAAEGRFAEFLGEDLIPVDIYYRTLGFWETAKQIEAQASDSLQNILQHYSDGINQYVEENKNNLPVEFILLDITPIEWLPTHSYALSRIMAWDQNMHWWSEITYAYLAEKLDPLQLQQLIPEYSDDYPTTITETHTVGAASAAMPFLETELDVRSLLNKRGHPFGSNAWAVNGSKTESGLPILAGDPHMGLSIPGNWYEVFYHTPQHQMAGATIPGSPLIVLGQNKNHAWTITNIMADDTDFFIEQISPGHPDDYITDHAAEPVTVQSFVKRNEVIRVKNGDDKLHIVRQSQNGPVITDIHPSSGLIADKVVTLKWKGHEISQELWALYKMNHARDMNDFREAVRLFESPGMNFIYADALDNIAIFTGASLPVREHNPLSFRKGWDPAYQWQHDIPFNELPHLVNPENGYVAHANNKMHPDSYPHYIASFWEPPSRILRINELIETSDSLTSQWMQTMQYDVYSIHAREITDIILPILRGGETSEQYREALSYLENWDYEYHPASTAASVFDLFLMKLSENMLKNSIGEEAYHALIRLEHLPVSILTRMLRDDGSFLNIAGSPQTESRTEMLRLSMAQAVDELKERFGPEPFEWRWENVNTLTLRPPLLGEASEDPDAPAILKMIVNNLFSKGPYPGLGHGMTINKGQYSWHKPFEVDLGASIRRIVDFSSADRSLTVLPTGQSGNPLSANYGDQTNLWLEGRYRYIYQDSTFFQQTSYQTMTLHPEH